MEIIKQGNRDLLNKTKQFNCAACGCIFRATKYEYEYSGTQYNINYWRCKCPTCSSWTYVED